MDSFFLAGGEGFEPPNAGTKTRCLTTWRTPNKYVKCGAGPPASKVLVPDRLIILLALRAQTAGVLPLGEPPIKFGIETLSLYRTL